MCENYHGANYELAKAEADKILDSFEGDMLKLQEQVEQLSRANDALTSENYGLRSKINAVDRVPVIFLVLLGGAI